MMPKHGKSHLEKDNPRTRPHPEEDGANPTQDGADPTQDQDGANLVNQDGANLVNHVNPTFQIEEDKEMIDILRNEMKNLKKKHEKEMLDSMKEELKRMHELKKVQEKEMKEIKEELERKNSEIRDRENIIASTKSTPSKGKKSVVVINITEENRDRVSILLGGMLSNSDGTYYRTPMSETWSRNKDIQLVTRHDTASQRPAYLDNIPDHPNPSTLDCVWSFKGEWRDAPMEADGTGAQGTKTRVARIEPYADYDGKIKKAICYGPRMGDLKVWYDFEEVKKIFPNWDTSSESLYYNGKTYTGTLKREYLEGGKKGKKSSGDQSGKDIQEEGAKGKGKRGGHSGGATGYSRGSLHNRNSERGREARNRDYKKWDEWQSAGTSRGGRSQDEFSDYSTCSEAQGRPRRKESPGYYTKGFSEVKKRDWSPSLDRNHRRERSIDRQRDSRDYYNSRRDHRSGYDSREYSSDRQERREHSPDRQGRRDHSLRQRNRQDRYENRTRDRKEYSSNEGRGYSGHR